MQNGEMIFTFGNEQSIELGNLEIFWEINCKIIPTNVGTLQTRLQNLNNEEVVVSSINCS